MGTRTKLLHIWTKQLLSILEEPLFERRNQPKQQNNAVKNIYKIRSTRR